MSTNPLFNAALSPKRRQSLVWVAVLLVVQWLAALILWRLNFGTDLNGLLWHGLSLLIVLVWATPVLTFLTTVTQVRRYVMDSSFKVLLSTALSPRAIFLGYTTESLVRMRWVLLTSPLLLLLSVTRFEGQVGFSIGLLPLLALWLLLHLLAAATAVWSVLRWGPGPAVWLIVSCIAGMMLGLTGLLRDSFVNDCPVRIDIAPVPWLPVLTGGLLLLFLIARLPALPAKLRLFELLPFLVTLLVLTGISGWLGAIQVRVEGSALRRFDAVPENANNVSTCSQFGIRCSCGRVTTIQVSSDFGVYSEFVMSELRHLHYLRVFEVNNADMPVMSVELTRLPYLERVAIANSNVEALPPQIRRMRSLNSLGLAANNLTELPPEIAELDNLASLRVSANNIESLPPEFGQLEQLEFLIADENNLSELPPEFADLQNLERVSFAANQFETVPAEALDAPQLQFVDMTGNPLRGVSDAACVDPRVLLDTQDCQAYCADLRTCFGP